MPHKINYHVVYASDEDPRNKALELNTHGPTVRGWQSSKNCDFPQEIILQLEGRAVLHKIQILLHQYLIPTKIEFFASNDDTNTISDVINIAWEYLGYITLSDNQSTGFKSRELKSANVPKMEASFIKLRMGPNHKNTYNIHNQVSLIAANILGIGVDPRFAHLEQTADAACLHKLRAMLNDAEHFSPFDDLAFDMYVDVDVARLIRAMELKKYVAVIGERYEYARKLKIAMEKLRTAGEKLGKYELEKRHAIEMEDYERAGRKKNQIDEFRSSSYQQLGVDQLLESNGVVWPPNDEPDDVACNDKLLSPVLKTQQQQPPSPLHKLQSPKSASPSIGSPTGMQQRGSFRRRNKSAGSIAKSTYEQYEDKPLPTLRHSTTNEFLRDCQLDVIEHRTVSKLTERERKQAALPILVFGTELVDKFYSKHYLDKEEGLNRLKDELLGYGMGKMHTANKTGRAAVFLLHRSLRDKVFSVYNLANEVIRLYFVQFVPGRVTPAEVSRSVDKLLPELLSKSGDTSARIHHMAVHTILTMAECKSVQELHIIPVHLSRPIISSTHPRLALSRAEMVEQLIINQGISTDKQSGLTCRTLSEFGSSGLHHPAEAVRKVAERILVLVYKVNPRLVRKQLPPDDDITRRNLLYRQLFHEFDKTDIQRKKELLDANRMTQQTYSIEVCNGSMNKCRSTMNISAQQADESERPQFTLTKSLSGGNFGRLQEDKNGSGVSTPTNGSKEEEDRHCIFCGQTESAIFAVSNSMNSHYWRLCPMLIRCAECSQVVEVAALTDHILIDCDQRENYTQCANCSEPVRLDELQMHAMVCTPLAEGCYRCPLCHDNLPDAEYVWKNHLMGERPCAKQTRAKCLVVKQVKIKL